MALPASLHTVTFADDFCDHFCIPRVDLPAALEEVVFGDSFNQSLDNVSFPSALRSIRFGYSFNQSLDRVTLPSALQHIRFHWNGWFRHSLDNNVTLPSTLLSITLSRRYFNKVSLDNVRLPKGCELLLCVSDGKGGEMVVPFERNTSYYTDQQCPHSSPPRGTRSICTELQPAELHASAAELHASSSAAQPSGYSCNDRRRPTSSWSWSWSSWCFAN